MHVCISERRDVNFRTLDFDWLVDAMKMWLLLCYSYDARLSEIIADFPRVTSSAKHKPSPLEVWAIVLKYLKNSCRLKTELLQDTETPVEFVLYLQFQEYSAC